MDATFAALMNKAKANTQAQSGLALAKQAELEAAKRREAELEKQNAAREKERKLKELEARRKREQERLLLEEKLRQEREQKRAQKEKEQPAASTSTAHVAKKGGKLPTATEPIVSANTKVVSVALKKKRRIDAMFSDDEGTSDASTSRKSGNSKHRVNGASGKGTRGMSTLSPNSDTLSAKEKLKLQFDPSQLRSLNENRKDVRTIEEIEQDYRRKQALAQPASNQSFSHGLFASRKTVSASSNIAGPPSAQASLEDSRSSGQKAGASAAPIASSSKTAASGSSKAKEATTDVQKRKRTDSPPTRKTASRSRSPPRKRPASPAIPSPPPKLSKTEARRQEIWAILNPHKASAPGFGAAYAGDEYSDDDDMEAGIDDIEEEDRRAARIARLEDKREEERLKQRAKEKAAKKGVRS